MPPKKPAADSVDAPVEEEVEAKSGAAAVRKLASHPSTFIMVKEALIELDSRKGVSSKAIQNYIKQKYPSVDLARLKHFVRRALKKGIETGTLVRPANSSVATGAMGKFRIAPKVKESKTENTDPNVQKAPKPAKDAAKKKSPKAVENRLVTLTLIITECLPTDENDEQHQCYHDKAVQDGSEILVCVSILRLH